MYQFDKEDLYYQHKYKWNSKSANDSAKHRGGLDRIQLNRSEGYEVRDFINDCIREFYDRLKSKTDKDVRVFGLEIEYMIHFMVPSDIRNRDEIFLWMVNQPRITNKLMPKD